MQTTVFIQYFDRNIVAYICLHKLYVLWLLPIYYNRIWFEEKPHRHVSHVLLHQTNKNTADNTFSWKTGEKRGKDEVVGLIDKGFLIQAEVWNYLKQ